MLVVDSNGNTVRIGYGICFHLESVKILKGQSYQMWRVRNIMGFKDRLDELLQKVDHKIIVALIFMPLKVSKG